MKKNRIVSLLIMILASLALLSSCSKRKPERAVELRDRGLIYDTNFGGAYVDITIDEFNDLGFKFGDSVDLVFSNGYELTDIPYYNGYYVDEGDPLLVGYPGYPHLKMGFNYGEDMWIVGGFSDDTTVTITVNEPEKYLTVQEAREITYGDEQGDQSDEKFGNYRAVSVGNLKEGILIRSASPCDNQHKRAAVVDRLISDSGVNFIINLSDNNEDIIEHINKDDFNSPYFLSLYEREKVIPLGLTASYKTDDFIGKVINGLTVAAENDGPYLVHCVEGKDRTGYVCMLLEALAGASYQEIIDDYMLTYDNYYDINQISDKPKYDLIKEKNIDCMLEYICNGEDYLTADLQKAAREYLVSKGMSEESVDKLQGRLTGTLKAKPADDEDTILFNTVHTYRFRMNYLRFGHGDRIMVILPGLSVQGVMGSAEGLAEEYRIFRDEFTVYVFDRIDNPPSSYTVEQMAADTAEAFRILGLKDIHLFGASQGGMMALIISREHPDLISSLVIGSATVDVDDKRYEIIDSWVSYAKEKDREGLYLRFGEKLYPEEIFLQYKDILVSMAETVTDRELENFIIMAEGTKGFDVTDRLDRISCDILALESDDDMVLGKDAVTKINSLMINRTNFHYYIYTGYGHASYDTAAPDYQQRVYDFFVNGEF